MTIGITCTNCGEEVVFWFCESKQPPVEECECGAEYRLKVERIDDKPEVLV